MTTQRIDGAMDGKTGWGMGRRKRREWSGNGMGGDRDEEIRPDG